MSNIQKFPFQKSLSDIHIFFEKVQYFSKFKAISMHEPWSSSQSIHKNYSFFQYFRARMPNNSKSQKLKSVSYRVYSLYIFGMSFRSSSW